MRIHPIYTIIFEERRIILFEKEPDLLTRSDCQRLLCISKSTILNLIHNDYISAFKLCVSYRIRKEDLIEFINNSAMYDFKK